MMIRRFLALVALTALAAPTFADNFNLGTLGVPSETNLSNRFYSPGVKTDNFTFTITGAAGGSGQVTEVDPWWNLLNVDITSVGILGGTTFTGSALSGALNFGVLAAGTYTLRIVTNVTGWFGLGEAGYDGKLKLRSSTSTSVPAPGVVLLYGLGLLGVGAAVRRRKVSASKG